MGLKIWKQSPKGIIRKSDVGIAKNYLNEEELDQLNRIVTDDVGTTPTDGRMYVFYNRHRNKLKILIWDRNGYIMGCKRLEKGRFDSPVSDNGTIEIDQDRLSQLIAGMPIVTNSHNGSMVCLCVARLRIMIAYFCVKISIEY